MTSTRASPGTAARPRRRRTQRWWADRGRESTPPRSVTAALGVQPDGKLVAARPDRDRRGVGPLRHQLALGSHLHDHDHDHRPVANRPGIRTTWPWLLAAQGARIAQEEAFPGEVTGCGDQFGKAATSREGAACRRHRLQDPTQMTACGSPVSIPVRAGVVPWLAPEWRPPETPGRSGRPSSDIASQVRRELVDESSIRAQGCGVQKG